MLDWIWFQQGDSVWAAVAIYSSGLVLSLFIGFVTATDKKGHTYHRGINISQFLTSVLQAASALFICGVLVVNAISFVTSWFPSSGTYGNAREATQLFGLQHEKAYPLVVGSRVGSSNAQAEAAAGLFSARASVSIQSVSAISVDFTYQDKNYILEIPASRVTFTQSSTAESTVKMYIADEQFSDIWHQYEYKSRCGIRNLWLVCQQVRTGSKREVAPEVRRHGLAPIINQHLDSASITLTPEMYKAILGSP